ncbi:hypothetical protein [Thiomicrorhabdus aquaedulcis]|uniref:hypothetical protein n=1 Tax=Thiomicrorhabdus aquaedulcis TaxID=2211106 RepID=UPI000FDCA8EE|nr:hypothetical protein [Thiomicrorhabdus aquaedulcis]
MQFKKRFIPITVRTLLLAGLLVSNQAWSFTQPCELVVKMADAKVYQAQPNRLASLLPLNKLPEEWQLTQLETHGAWFVYSTTHPDLSYTQCAPLSRLFNNKPYEFMPVFLNKQTGVNAVLTGTFIVKSYEADDLDKIVNRYGFKLLTRLPNPLTAIVDVLPQTSFDTLLETLDRDKDVQFAVPILSEPRYKTR